MNIFWSDGLDKKTSKLRELLNDNLTVVEERDVTGPFWSKYDFYKERPNRSLPLLVLDNDIICNLEELLSHYAQSK
jgi:hypothetical protein